jgi:hypothetical protein
MQPVIIPPYFHLENLPGSWPTLGLLDLMKLSLWTVLSLLTRSSSKHIEKLVALLNWELLYMAYVFSFIILHANLSYLASNPLELMCLFGYVLKLVDIVVSSLCVCILWMCDALSFLLQSQAHLQRVVVLCFGVDSKESNWVVNPIGIYKVQKL